MASNLKLTDGENRKQSRCSLYAGNLDDSVTEVILHEIFSDVGNLASVRVCRDTITGKSLGYAYINFNCHEDAKTALQRFAFTFLRGQPMRLMWQERDPCLRNSGVGNIFVKNLASETDEPKLYQTFLEFGEILSCKVARDSSGNSLGYGFVHFSQAESANLAVEKARAMDSFLLDRKRISVAPFKNRAKRKQELVVKFMNVYVKQFPFSVTVDELRVELFEPYGDVISLYAPSSEIPGQLKGYACCSFGSHEAAEKCVEELHEKEWKGRTLFAAPHQRKTARYQQVVQTVERNLYIKNLATTVTDDALRTLFITYGPVVSAKVMRDADGNSKGFGFVCFVTTEHALAAKNGLHGQMFLANKPIYVAVAQSKEDRRKELERRFAQQPPHGGHQQALGMVPPPPAHYHPHHHHHHSSRPTPPPHHYRHHSTPTGYPWSTPSNGPYQRKRIPNSLNKLPFTKPYYNHPHNYTMQQIPVQKPFNNYTNTPSNSHLPVPHHNSKNNNNNNNSTYRGKNNHSNNHGSMADSNNPLNSMNTNLMNNIHNLSLPQPFTQGNSRPMNEFMPSQASFNSSPVLNSYNNPPPPPAAPLPPSRPSMHSTKATHTIPTTNHLGAVLPSSSVSGPESCDNTNNMKRRGFKNMDVSSTGMGLNSTSDKKEQESEQLLEKHLQNMGEHLYPRVHKLYPKYAGKLTGMLLEMENHELMQLLQDQEIFEIKVEEAKEVLFEHINVSE